MNTDYKDLVDQMVSAIPRFWEADNTAAMFAYHHAKEKRHMRTEHSDQTSLILAGVQSCVLANQVLSITWGDPGDPQTQVTVACAKAVLKCWGIDLSPLHRAAPIKNDPPTPEPATLVWPPVDRTGLPLTPVLPDVYRENYYYTIGSVEIPHPRDASILDWSILAPSTRLVLHESYWNHESLVRRMRFSAPSIPGLAKFWLDHSQVKPGEEIPKVIESATQARNNDP